MIIGLNNGGFYRLTKNRISDNILDKIIKTGANAIEFTCVNIKMVDDLFSLKMPKNKIKFFSIHAPITEYKVDNDTRGLLNKFDQITKKLDINNIIIHADNIKDNQIFKSFAHLPLSVENSDNRKDFGKRVNDIKLLLDNSDLKLTLDLQHCYVNDKTMQLADDFYKEFCDKIVEFHVSGYDKEFNHYTLFKTNQDIIIDFLKEKNIPIILESTYDKYSEAKIELNYVKNKL